MSKRDRALAEAVTRNEIILLTTDFKPNPGGIGEYLHSLAESLHARGSRIAVVTYDLPGRSKQVHAPYTLVDIHGPSRLLGSRLGDAFAPFRKVNSLVWHVRNRRAAAGVATAVRAHSDGQAVLVGVWDHVSHYWCSRFRRHGLPYWIFVYGRELVASETSYWSKRRAEDIKAASRIVACSSATQRLAIDVLGLPPGSVSVLRPGCRFPKTIRDAPRSRERLRRQLEIPSDAVVFGTLGRLVERKGVHLVIRAVSRLHSRGLRAFYAVGGSGPDLPKLRELTAELGLGEYIRFLEHLDEGMKWTLLEMLDVFVLGNHERGGADFEGFGIVLLEAAAVGLPVVAGDNGGVREAVAAGKTGFLVKIRANSDVQPLALALERLLCSSRMREQMGRAGRQRVMRDFCWVDRARQFQGLMRRKNLASPSERAQM